MSSSKEMRPSSSPFFPHMFFNNQFRAKPVWPPADTDLTDQVALVTGANSGLGLEASTQLLSLGLSRLIMGVRSTDKGEAVAKTLRGKYPKAAIDVYALDMSSYEAIQAFVAQLEQLERLDIAILNAGIRKMKHGLVAGTGHEEMIQINYISTALLCLLLLPILKRKSKGPGRITISGSGLAFQAKFRNRQSLPLLSSFDTLENFDALDQYNTSKLLGMMFLYKLTDRVSADDVVVNVVDPGFVRGTLIGRDLSLVQSAVMTTWKQIAARSLDVGASTYVNGAVVHGKESHGSFLMNWTISPFVELMYTSEGEQIMERLWQETIAELRFAKVEGIISGLKMA